MDHSREALEAQAVQRALWAQLARPDRGPVIQGISSSRLKRPHDDNEEDAKPHIRSPPSPATSQGPSHGGHLAGWRGYAMAMALSGQVPPLLAGALYQLALGNSAVHAPAPSPDAIPKAVLWPEGLERFKGGRILHTRTPGRALAGAPNCIELHELVRAESMVGAWMNFYIPEFDFLAPLLPIAVDGASPHRWRSVPLHVSGDINGDPLRNLACTRAGVPVPDRALSGKDKHDDVARELHDLWRAVAGPNWQAVYPRGAGCVHTKAFVVRYPGFVLVVITSANAMRGDMELLDNHWFVQSFPKLPAPQRGSPPTDFEQRLFAHMETLGCPPSFLDQLRGKYDFRATDDRVHLVPSTPRVKGPNTCDDFGAFRLNALARRLIPREERHDVQLEFCCGSVGPLHEEGAQAWMKRMDRLLRGRNPQRAVEVDVDALDLPRWRIVFPTSATVNACEDDVRAIASNIGCCIRSSDWQSASAEVRSLFHDYQSKDFGRLFHEKSILWLRPSPPPSTTAPSTAAGDTPTGPPPPPPPPYMAYFGSHNLSKAAWGEPALVPGKGDRSPSRKLSPGANNFELGVVVRGEDLVSMLEDEGASSWEDVVTYVTPARPYRSGERAWNSNAWVREAES